MPHLKRRAAFYLIVTALAIFALASLMIILMMRPAWSHGMTDVGLPAGITCELVREKVAEHGKAASLAWAIKQGYSFAQIRRAKRCLN